MTTQTHGMQRIVVKVGSSILTDGRGRPLAKRLRQIAQQLAACRRQGRDVILVSSGAIACGMGELGIARRPKELSKLQACAAVGQGRLMQLYHDTFSRNGVAIAQVLLTQADLTHRTRCHNAKKTLQELLKQGVVPIINENDAVAVEEIAFGDNDRLAALVACVVGAQLLVVLSDVDGFLRDGRVVERIDAIDHTHQALAMRGSRETTTGGMASKLSAARIARHGGIPMIIANGTKPAILLDILSGQPVGTLIAPPRKTLKFHKWWIAFSARTPRGTVIVNSTAEAQLKRGAGLAASAIRTASGAFHAGDPVAIIDSHGAELGRGLSNFSARELSLIRDGIVIDKKNLVLAKEFDA